MVRLKRSRHKNAEHSTGMGDFQRPPNYFARKVQWRLLIMVGMLMLVFVLMMEAAKPENWYWMWGGRPPVVGNEPLTDDEITSRDVDTRLKKPLPTRLTDVDSLDTFLAQRAEEPPLEVVDPAAEFVAGVGRDKLETIRDDTMFRSDEADAWFHLLDLLDRTPLEQLQEQAIGRTGFIQLYEQPNYYRGKLVTVRGSVRAAHPTKSYQNDYGIEDVWRIVLRPAGGPESPIIVYTLGMPDGFPKGERIYEDVEFTGFFFKRWAYQAQDDIRVAPLILAKTAVWDTPMEAESSTPAWLAFLIVGVIGSLLGIAISAFIYLTSRQTDKTTQRVEAAAEQRGVRAAEGLEPGPDVGERLRQLAEEEGKGE